MTATVTIGASFPFPPVSAGGWFASALPALPAKPAQQGLPIAVPAAGVTSIRRFVASASSMFAAAGYAARPLARALGAGAIANLNIATTGRRARGIRQSMTINGHVK